MTRITLSIHLFLAQHDDLKSGKIYMFKINSFIMLFIKEFNISVSVGWRTFIQMSQYDEVHLKLSI